MKHNNYIQRYINFIVQAKKNELEAGVKSVSRHKRVSKEFPGFESHHIRPKCINGDDEFSNRVLLDHEDHRYAHMLLIFALYQLGMNNEVNAIQNHGGCSKLLLTNRAFEDVRVIRTHNLTKQQEVLTFKAAVKFHASLTGVKYDVNDALTIKVANSVLSLALSKSKSHSFSYELYLGRCHAKLKRMFLMIASKLSQLGEKHKVTELLRPDLTNLPKKFTIFDPLNISTEHQDSQPVSEACEAC